MKQDGASQHLFRGVCLAGMLFLLVSCTGRVERSPQPSRPPSVSGVQNKTGIDQGSGAEFHSGTAKLEAKPWPKCIEPLDIDIDSPEQLGACGKLCEQLAQVLSSRDFSQREWTVNAELVFPKLRLVWRMYAGRASGAEIEARPEARVIYDYLLGSNEKAENTLRRLSALICWKFLDRVWLEAQDQLPQGIQSSWGSCPQNNKPYLLDNNQLSCYTHGISLTFPDHTARPAVDELILQLCNGNFNAEKRRELEFILCREPLTAVQAGETVADLGCGVGKNALTMSLAAGKNGHVIAVDINNEVLNFLSFAKSYYEIDNIETLHASDFDPALKENSVDRAFMIDLYDSMAMRNSLSGGAGASRTDRYMYKLAAALKPNGKLIIVDNQATPNVWHLPAALVAGNCLKYGLREIKWYKMDIGGVPKQVVILQKQNR